MFNYNGNKLQALPLWIYNALRQQREYITTLSLQYKHTRKIVSGVFFSLHSQSNLR